jgi:diguanylate cyclase (GGDEF)-like protein
MTRDQLLADLSRAVRSCFPDRADEILRELESRVLPDEYKDVDRLYRELSHDALTGLWMRRAILFLLELERAAVVRDESRTLSIAVVDVDEFRLVNGRLGPAAGDRLLADLGTILVAAVRPDDTIGRLGGEEFLVVMRRTTAHEAAQVAEAIRASVERHTFLGIPGEPELNLTVSIGLATATGSRGRAGTEELIRIAEENVRAAKTAGRNRVAS